MSIVLDPLTAQSLLVVGSCKVYESFGTNWTLCWRTRHPSIFIGTPTVLRIFQSKSGTSLGLELPFFPYHMIPYIQPVCPSSTVWNSLPSGLCLNVWVLALYNVESISAYCAISMVQAAQLPSKVPLVEVALVRRNDPTHTSLMLSRATFFQILPLLQYSSVPDASPGPKSSPILTTTRAIQQPLNPSCHQSLLNISWMADIFENFYKMHWTLYFPRPILCSTLPPNTKIQFCHILF